MQSLTLRSNDYDNFVYDWNNEINFIVLSLYVDNIMIVGNILHPYVI